MNSLKGMHAKTAVDVMAGSNKLYQRTTIIKVCSYCGHIVFSIEYHVVSMGITETGALHSF
jgi:hypothetical protein